MNIFEFLGLPADHRKENKVTQLVKHYDEVVDKHKNKSFVGQIKKDGVCSLTVILDGAVRIFSRTGKAFTNVQHIEATISDMTLRDGVYMGELCCPYVSLEKLSGVVNPNRVNPLDQEVAHVPENLFMHWFDLVSINSFKKGSSQTAFTRRHSNLVERVGVSSTGAFNVGVLPYYELADEEAIKDFALEVIDVGEEGIVIRDPNADWEAGHKGWRVMKKVRGVGYDLRCIDFEEGTGKYAGKVANLIFTWKNGKTIKAMLGKGWSHNDAERMYHSIKIPTNPGSPIGQIFQVYALEESSQGKLRLPKVGELRHDKTESDV